jgi:hypothetical protein
LQSARLVAAVAELGSLGGAIMRAKFILILLVVFEVFFLGLLCSPGVLRSKGQLSATAAWLQSPSPETERAHHLARDRDRRKQYVLFGFAVVVGISIIVYGASQHRRTA